MRPQRPQAVWSAATKIMDLDLKVTGLDQLAQNLTAFTQEIQEKALNKALVAGAQPIAREMAAQAPRSHDIGPRQKNEQHIADSIVIKTESKPVGSAAEVYVGPSKSVSSKARWMELGAAAHAIVAKLTRQMMKSGVAAKKVLASSSQVFGSHVEHPGVHPRPFMRPALDASAKDALDAMKQSLAQSMKDAIRRAAKKFTPSRS
jgi:HK97 gp10 family phage protein